MLLLSVVGCTDKEYDYIELAKENGCMTELDFFGLMYTYNYENALPCLVLAKKLAIDDITNRPDSNMINIEWVGEPSHRQNEAWVRCSYPYYYVGLTSQQLARIHNMDIQYYINKPVILRVYQAEVGNGGVGKHFVADLVSIIE